ncbi:MAG: hypothetical protein IT305_31085 [Chloroflexi bacterium]|nr:hypothetical protein [Chloroflexota bacterium]
MTALWVHEVAEQFWHHADGAPSRFPRDLRDALAWALPVTTVELSRLSVARVDGWLAEHAAGRQLDIPNRPLRACMLAIDGHGLLFIDATDEEDERRFSLAHEAAHYLVEYAVPHARARARLGDDVLPVLDGRRTSSPDERIGALLSGVSLGLRLHLMERTSDGHAPGHGLLAAERRADDLAFELLAPVDEVRTALPHGARRTLIEATLRATFGLPAAPARGYASRLAPRPPAGSLFRQLFGGS